MSWIEEGAFVNTIWKKNYQQWLLDLIQQHSDLFA